MLQIMYKYNYIYSSSDRAIDNARALQLWEFAHKRADITGEEKGRGIVVFENSYGQEPINDFATLHRPDKLHRQLHKCLRPDPLI